MSSSGTPVRNGPAGNGPVRNGPVRNGMAADQIPGRWKKPWSGTNGGDCVEAVEVPGERIALRQSTDPTGPALLFTLREIAAVLKWAKSGGGDALIHRHEQTTL